MDGDGKKALQISVLGILVPAVISIVVWLWPNPLQSDAAGAQASSPAGGAPAAGATSVTVTVTPPAESEPPQGIYSAPAYPGSPSSAAGGLLPLSEAYGGECFNYLPTVTPGAPSIDPLPSAMDVEQISCFQPHDAQVILRMDGDNSSLAWSTCDAEYSDDYHRPAGSRDYIQMLSYQGQIGAVCVVTFDTPATGLL